MNLDAEISRGVFSRLGTRRQERVALGKVLDAAMDACPCERRCSCTAVADAQRAYDAAGYAVGEAEASWREWHAATAA